MTSFAERLQKIAQRGQGAEVGGANHQDIAAAWVELSLMPTQANSAVDVLQLGSLAAQVAGTSLGRFVDAADFLAGLRNHPAVQDAAEVVRSLWRAEGVMRRCAGGDDHAHRTAGISTPAEACRYAGVLAQTLAMRGRLNEALPHLREATGLCGQLAPDDAVVTQTTVIAANLGRLALEHAHRAHELALAAGEASLASDGRQADWRRRHLAQFAMVRALLIAGRPGDALRTLHALMDLEDAQGAGAFERFHTAALACRAYHARGDDAQAARTLEACRDFAKRATANDVSADLTELEKILKGPGV